MVAATLYFLPSSQTGGPTRKSDLRQPNLSAASTLEPVTVDIADARTANNIGVHESGFELLNAPSAVKDFADCDEVMAIYYEECKALAAKLTGATATFTFDHIIREKGSQYSGGGTDGSMQRSGVERGGGYISSVHMDYTDNTTWQDYLAVHGEQVPQDYSRVYALNFWRPLSASVDDQPLAVCDARTVDVDDLQEVVIYGYGAENYSWHNIGIETFSVAANQQQQWYYYPGMAPADVLVIKSFDSAGVVGNTCPHGSFTHPTQNGVQRRSIELRVLCFG